MKFEKLEEGIVSELSSLYRQYGYKRYKPSSFEEFSLYQENKDFLISKNVITFSDLSGKLMAMRPDITLSLVKHRDVVKGDTEKYFYCEKVYRQAAGSRNYKEISQTGVEVIGAIDGAVVAELTILICKTLSSISSDFILDVSHMGFIQGFLNEFGSNSFEVAKLLKSKNLHDFSALAKKRGFSESRIAAFKIAVTEGSKPEQALKEAEQAVLNQEMQHAVEELRNLFVILDKFGYGDKININFSAVNNADYYNGIIFNGYIKGVPHCVLTGGRYDKLLQKMGKAGGAIGFALYLGEIERYLSKESEIVDYLIIYNGKTQFKALELAQSKMAEGYA
ncbi:MAG: ATP phosphoribosyltransferase regulatory subunit, partial [Clostridia bacterium]|nr:ATP phosphoribosyltransferase regulatory subunit [Clostridia bacterium]